jgi:hypothetical protein
MNKFQAFQVPGKGWNVRTRDAHGQWLYLTTGGPYTIVQAQAAASACQRDVSRHGADSVHAGMLLSLNRSTT